MTRATKKPRATRARFEVVLLDAAWVEALPGVERLVRKRRARRRLGRERRGSLTVALSDDKRVQALNRRDRKKDKPTNVLSYPSGERLPGRHRAGAPDRVARGERAEEDAGRSCRASRGARHAASVGIRPRDAERRRRAHGSAGAAHAQEGSGSPIRYVVEHLQRLLALGRREGAVELGQHLRRKLDVERAEILLHPFAGRRLRNGDHAGLGQHPGERELRRRAADLVGELLQGRVASSPPWSSGE